MSDEIDFGDARPLETLVDPSHPTFSAFFGKKGSGKSHLAARFWQTWPFDRIAVDPMHDAKVGDDVQRVEVPLPTSWPLTTDERVSLHFMPDMRSATFADDLDHAVGLAMSTPKAVLCWCDEIGLHSRANATAPNMRGVLHHGRHKRVSMLMCGPRPIDIDPLVIAQSDFVYVFDMPNPADQKRVANVIGYPPDAFAVAVQGLGDHEYLRWDGDELVHFPPLPARTLEIPRTDRLDGAPGPADGRP